MRLNAMHGSGSLGTKVLGTIAGSYLCGAGIGTPRNRIATEIRTALMLRLLRPWNCSLGPPRCSNSPSLPFLEKAASEGIRGEPDFVLALADLDLAENQVGLGRDVFHAGSSQLVKNLLGFGLIGWIEVTDLGFVVARFHEDLNALDQRARRAQ